ncbi:MAG: hybrid sensor histidine kinase/response regulator [Candidatus Aminicenantes bacterium]|nr:hybrid sensor histidine kinase/response regulator [Candidatus Aminicenantes bacterium]
MNDNNHNHSPLILIVDDNQDYLNYLATILVENGYEIAAARDKKEALAYLDTSNIERIDLVLLDISLSSEGDTEGFEVCKRFKQSEKAKHIPIIFLSHHENEEVILRGFNEGGVDYISKRVSAKSEKEMLARIKTHAELKRSRDIIEKQIKELRELNATKDKFFRIIAHDLRNPFITITEESKFIGSNYKTLNEEQRVESIGIISSASRRVFKLLENLLEWAKMQLKEIKIQKTFVDLNPIIEENISLYEEIARKKKIAIHNAVTSPCNAFADKYMIDLVVRNLINNAVKFTENGGKIEITGLDKGELIEISVSDTGVGIAEAVTGKLFHIDGGHTTPGTDGEKGSGLGLILCKDFLTANDGEIRVESQEGKGSTFIVTLPRNSREAAQ